MDKINNAINTVIDNAFKGVWSSSITGELKSPLKDGDKINREEYKDCFYINASSRFKPGVLDVNGLYTEDMNKIYPGCYCRLSLSFYPYMFNGQIGIGCNLNNIFKASDGTVLNNNSAMDDFADYLPKAF